jgi:O-antigen/teichoic acid export membrane protein
MEQSRESERLLKDVVVVGAADLLKTLSALIVIPIIAKWLGAEAYGIWVQVRVSAAFLSSLGLLGLNRAMLRFMSGEERRAALTEQFHTVLWAGLVSCAVVAVLLVAFDTRAAHAIFSEPGLTVFVTMTAVLLLLEAIDSVLLAYLRATRQMTLHAAFLAVELIGELVVVGSLAIVQMNIVSILLGVVVWRTFMVLLKLGRVWLQIGVRRPRAAMLPRYLAFGLPLLLSSVAYFVVNYGDRYLINSFMGIEAVGIYAVAYAVGSLPIVLCTPIDYVLYPAIASCWNRGDEAGVERHIGSSFKWMSLLLMPILAGLLVLLNPIMNLVASPEFLSAAPAARVVALAFAVFSLGVLGERILTLANRPRFVSALYCFLAVVNVSLNLVLIPRWGVLGAALATLAAFAVYAAITFWASRQYCRFPVPIGALLKGAVAAAAAGVVAAMLGDNQIWKLGSAVIAGAVVYGTALVALGAVRLHELTALASLAGWRRPAEAQGPVTL